jgi:hypothetical protein
MRGEMVGQEEAQARLQQRLQVQEFPDKDLLAQFD